MHYAHLHTITNFTFLTGASHPGEYVARAAALGYSAIAITDECSLAGIVKAYVASKEFNIKLLVGSRFTLSNGITLIAIAPTHTAYAELSGFITLARRRAAKGEYEAHWEDLRFRLQQCLVIWLPQPEQMHKSAAQFAEDLASTFKERLWMGFDLQLAGGEETAFFYWLKIAQQKNIPPVACGCALMHETERKPLQDVLTAIQENSSVQELGTRLQSNAEAYLKTTKDLAEFYPAELLTATQQIAELCSFTMGELRYQYPEELVPEGLTPSAHLKNLVNIGKKKRWPKGVKATVEALLEKELALIAEQQYEYFFLTVYDIVQFARANHILCQGRGSAANSVVCYCLFITEIAPGQINVLFERFISKERDEPPDIDVDFEHERREEVIQYIYKKYGRERAALAATVITYRTRSAIRDVGKALGLEPTLIDHFAKSMAWWDRASDLPERIAAAGLQAQQQILLHFFSLLEQIIGFPRHLSQHVGGFVISQTKVSDLVPLENASMADRTIIQWDKEDLEAMCLLKVDVLALGMLTALRKTLALVNNYEPHLKSLADIPGEDKATYDMLSAGDSVGVFQVESRAQISMLPRLRPQTFYDLVVQIAIVRPGPIQGGMVHPYLRRRNKEEPETYPNKTIKAVLESTYGVPIFQEQAIRLAMVAAGFSAGRADALRRAMASWGKNSKLLHFEPEFIAGMLANGYELDFAQRLFEQIKGFGGYGFPESHSASFALLCYASSWLKCHHPAAFYCALLNSQPMGFYSPSQLIQDARRHNIIVLPVDINCSGYDNTLEKISAENNAWVYAIRLGFCQVASLNSEKALQIEHRRGANPFLSLQDLTRRGELSKADLQCLAAADVLRSLSGNRHQALWQTAALTPFSPLLDEPQSDRQQDDLLTPAPNLEKDVVDDYQTLGLTLRAHPMALLREEYPFNRCTRQSELAALGHGRFVRVAGLVTGRQRPGTAKGTLFVTLEDETGNINVVVWKGTQEHFRQPLLTSRLLLIKGVVEVSEYQDNQHPVVHVVAGHLQDYSERLENLPLRSRDFH